MENVVLVGVDGSAGSASAAAWALAEAAARKWSILFVNVVSASPVADPRVEAGYFRGAVREAERLFEPLMADAEAKGILAEAQVVAGRSGEVLVRLSARARLAVVGRRHRTGYTSRLGSVSAALAARSACCTAVIPQTWSPDRSAPDTAPVKGRSRFFGQVIAAVEAGPAAPALLAAAAEMALRHCVPLCAVTVSRNGTEQDSDLWLPNLLLQIRDKHPRLQCHSSTLAGSPATEITQAARGARLLVIGTRGLSGIPGIIHGSVSQAILESMPSPVLVVRFRPPAHSDS